MTTKKKVRKCHVFRCWLFSLEVLELEASPSSKYVAICGEKKVDFFLVNKIYNYWVIKSLNLDPDTDSMTTGLDPDPVQCIWICNTGITIANASFLINK
jgi:hypothetical protein